MPPPTLLRPQESFSHLTNLNKPPTASNNSDASAALSNDDVFETRLRAMLNALKTNPASRITVPEVKVLLRAQTPPTPEELWFLPCIHNGDQSPGIYLFLAREKNINNIELVGYWGQRQPLKERMAEGLQFASFKTT